MLRYFPLILKNCWRNRRRTTLTVLSVAASLSLLGVLMAIYYAFYFSQPLPEQALRLATRNKVSLVFPLPESYGVKIRRVPGVREVMMQNWFGGIYKDDRPENMFARFFVEPDKIFTLRPEMRLPDEQKVAFQRERTSCLVGKRLADRHHWKIGDRVTLKGDIFPINVELLVAAIFEASEGEDVLYFHRKYVEESVSESIKGLVGMFYVLADTPESVPRISRAIDDEFRNATAATKTEPERAFQLGFVNMLGNVKAFLLSICAAVTFTILLVSANTMAMSVRERTREVGILKTLGFTRGKILGLILGEAVLLSLAGGALGLAFAQALCGLMRQAPAMISQFATLSVPGPVALACLALAAAIGAASSFVPAWNAAGTPIVEAIRSTD